MNQALLVHEVDARANLNEEIKRRVFAQVLFFPDQVKQVSFGRVLESQVNRCAILKTRKQAADVLVIQLLLYPDFTNERLLNFAVGQFG